MVHKLTDIIITFILQRFSNNISFTSFIQKLLYTYPSYPLALGDAFVVTSCTTLSGGMLRFF